MVHKFITRFSYRVRRFYFPRRTYSSQNNVVRVRFAPSPTGNLHLGGLRTALYNYLYARKNGGKFVLRIEDTDQKRVKQGSMESLEQMLSWAGISPDEGPSAGGAYGPYIQSQRVENYREKANDLLKSGHAYRCFCSEIRLDIMRKDALKNRQNPRYDNKCRSLSASEIDTLLSRGQPFTIRFKLQEGPVTFEDVVFGTETTNISDYEGDFIILKSDGFPTYHFACVVDDNSMDISHVLRGAEWLLSTPKHIMLHQAFGWKPPTFAHLPLLVNRDRSKLSKRQEALGIQYLKEKGYEPLALLNFLCGMGTGFDLNARIDILEIEELTQKFNLCHVSKSSCCLDMEKLDVYNTKYFIRQLSQDNSAQMLVTRFRLLLAEKFGKRYEDQANHLSDDYIRRILDCYKERINTLTELVEGDYQYLWALPDTSSVFVCLKDFNISTEDAIEDVEQTLQALSSIPDVDFELPVLKVHMKKLSKGKRLSPSLYMRMLRIVLTGQKDGPGIAEIFTMLRKKETLRKMREVLAFLEADPPAALKQSS